MEFHKPPFRLRELKLEVTHDCNLRCSHCSSLAEPGCGRQMTPAVCRKILDDAASMGVTNVAFSGGEPLLWEDLPGAVGAASGYGMAVDLYTTGNVPYATHLLEALQQSGVQRVMFSVFGSDAESHERVTTVRGSYAATMSATTHCVRLGLDTEFHFVPLAHNFSELAKIAEHARELGVKRVSVLRFVPQGRGAATADMQLSKTQNLDLRRIIQALRADGHRIRLGSPYNFLMLRDDPKCCAGIDRLSIGPDLRVFPCDAFKHLPPEVLGVGAEYSNLTHCTLAECWEKAPYLQAVREYLTTDFADECAECSALEDCLSGCMAQKFHAYGKPLKCPDPMCLMRN